MRRRLPVALLVVLAVSGCFPRPAAKARKLEGRYVAGHPGEEWAVINSGGADLAWRHVGGATIYTDSNCGKRYQDGRLPSLMDNLLRGLEAPEVLEERELSLDGRGAFFRRMLARLDGVPVEVAAVVMKKGECSYDIVYIGPPPASTGPIQDLFTVLEGFSTERRR